MLLENLVTRRVSEENASNSSLTRRVTKQGYLLLAALVRKITDAVHYAHLKGVVHRDLKPGNVLLDPNGEPRVTGFGLAKQVDTEASNSATRAAAMIRLARAEVFLIRRSSPLLTSLIGRSPV